MTKLSVLRKRHTPTWDSHWNNWLDLILCVTVYAATLHIPNVFRVAWTTFFFFRFSPLCVLFFCLKGQQQEQETTREERDRDRGKQSENAIRETVDSKSESEMKLTQNPYAEQFHWMYWQSTINDRQKWRKSETTHTHTKNKLVHPTPITTKIT